MAKNGFTLIELSIVLIIIGLLVAGVVGGQSLIHQAKLRSVVVDINTHNTALNIFRLEYDYYPGDLPNATDYWPTQCVDDGTNTCNGNGNGEIIDATGSESIRVWQHLTLAGINQFSGTGLIGSGYVAGDNVPGSAIEGGAFLVYSVGQWSTVANGVVFSGNNSNHNFLGGAVFTPPDAHSVDRKMDDGIPTSGLLQGMWGLDLYSFGGDIPCISSETGDAVYNLSTQEKECFIWMNFN